MKRLSLAIAALAILAIVPAVLGETIADQFDATCRVRCGNSTGTGFVYGMTPQYVGVLTNWHVVTAEGKQAVKSGTCEFWSTGFQSRPLPAQVVAAERDVDAAVLVVPRSAFAGREPKRLPFAKQNPPVGSEVRSVGCSNGSWATAWRGHVTRYSGIDMLFTPGPANGRSGSAICNQAGEVVGLLHFRIENGSKTGEGGAVAVEALLKRMYPAVEIGMKNFVPCAALTQCPGGVCPIPYGSQPQASPYTIPDPPQSNLGEAYPDLSAAQGGAGGGSLFPWRSKIDRELDEIKGSLNRPMPTPAPIIVQAPPVAAPLPATPVGPDPQTAATLAQHGQSIDSLGKGLAATNDIVGKVAENQAKHGTLLERLAAKREGLGRDEESGEGTKDRLLEIFKQHWPAVAIGGAVLLFLLVRYHVRHGHSLLRDIVDKASADHPNLRVLGAVTKGVDRIDDRVGAVAQTVVPGLAAANPALAAGLSATEVMRFIKDHVEARLAPAPGQPQTTSSASPVGIASTQAPAAGTTINVATPAGAATS